MLAAKRLAEMQRSSEGRGSLRKKPPPITQQQEVMSMDSPPPDGEFTDESLLHCNEFQRKCSWVSACLFQRDLSVLFL